MGILETGSFRPIKKHKRDIKCFVRAGHSGPIVSGSLQMVRLQSQVPTLVFVQRTTMASHGSRGEPAPSDKLQSIPPLFGPVKICG